MNNYYEAMVHQGEATSPSARQVELVLSISAAASALHMHGKTSLCMRWLISKCYCLTHTQGLCLVPCWQAQCRLAFLSHSLRS